MKKRILSLLLLLSLLLSLALPVSAASPFTDVPESYWAYADVLAAYADGVIQGTGEGKFSPEGTLTYAQWSVILARAYYADEVAQQTQENWYNREMAVLQAHGAYQGLGSVPIDRPVSRGDMAVMIANIMKDQGAKMPTETQLREIRYRIRDLNDTPEDKQQAVLTCFYLDILNGTAPGVFSAGQAVRRDAAAAIYVRVRDAIAAPREEPPASQTPTLTNGQPITEENVRALINDLRPLYPEGLKWTNDNGYLANDWSLMGYGCAAFALICGDAAFGSLPITERHADFDRIRAGDVLRIHHDTHSVVVLEKRPNSVIVTEGNYAGAIHWDRELTRADLQNDGLEVRTRYPQ